MTGERATCYFIMKIEMKLRAKHFTTRGRIFSVAGYRSFAFSFLRGADCHVRDDGHGVGPPAAERHIARLD